MYRNPNFQRDRPGLLENIRKKADLRIVTAWPGCVPIPSKRKKPVAATRRSPRIQQKESTKEDKAAPKEAPNVPGPSGSRSFTSSGVCSLSTVAAMENFGPGEQGGPSGEGTSRNVMFEPPATAGREGTGELTTAPHLTQIMRP